MIPKISDIIVKKYFLIYQHRTFLPQVLVTSTLTVKRRRAVQGCCYPGPHIGGAAVEVFPRRAIGEAADEHPLQVPQPVLLGQEVLEAGPAWKTPRISICCLLTFTRRMYSPWLLCWDAHVTTTFATYMWMHQTLRPARRCPLAALVTCTTDSVFV